MSAGGRRVRDEEATLWQHVARDVTPIPKRVERSAEDEASEEPAAPPKQARKARKAAAPAKPAPRRQPSPPPLPALDPTAPAGLDKRTARRLKRGQLPVEARLDLHGKTEAQAHEALRRFIGESRMAGRRCVQVITGKGSVASGEGGVLRRMAPRWLNEPALRRHVVAISNPPESGGGAGALNVLLKSRKHAAPDRGP